MATNTVVDLDEYKTPKKRTPQQWASYWQKEMAAAEKRTRKFVKEGNRINHRYLDDNREQTDSQNATSTLSQFRLNLFYTNVSTMQAMLFGTTPKTVVSREHADPDDDIARVAAMLLKRLLDADNYDMDSDFATVLKAALQDRLLPGLGMARVRYEATMKKEPQLDPATGQTEEVQVTDDEFCNIDYVHWQDIRWGWGRTWIELPWLAYRSFLTKDEARKRFGEKIAESLTYKLQTPDGEDKSASDDKDLIDNVQKAEIWEIWHKTDKTVFWWSDGVDKVLDMKPDPLKLSTFWPSPKPLTANVTTSLFMPKGDFTMAKDLYNEIDELQSRIALITEALRVVGVYDKNAGAAVGRMLKEAGTNDLIPVDNWAMFAEKGGLKGTIEWFPLQEIAATLQALQAIRGDTIQLLYEITGMSDILRGANTDQYAAEGTQQLKAKFGSIRVQAIQEEFARFASSLESLKAEVISKHYSPRTIIVQSNAAYIPSDDVERIPEAVDLIQSPDVRWRVKIAPESVAMVDYAAIKAERSEFLTAMATYIQSAQAMAKSVPGSLPVMLEMMKWSMAGFKGSDYMEGIMDKAIDQALKMPPPKDPNDGKAAEQQAASQAELQKIQAKGAADLQLVQAKGQQELQKIQQDFQANMQEMQAKSQADQQKIMADLQADLKVIAAKLGADLQVEEAQSTMAVAEKEVEHAYAMTEQGQQHGYTMNEIDEAAESRETGEDDD